MLINAYLNFPGTCEEAFALYAGILGGEIVSLMRYKGMPMGTPEGWDSKILHATIRIGPHILMGSDTAPDHYRPPAGFSVSISTDNLAEAERIFAALATGGETSMPLQKTFWAAGFGMCTDRFGIPWMINCENSPH
jgi:PhnB protein